ncbi:MAG: hypothetical protein OEV72_05495 [Thermoleophilia bacterium]|nr:hypothetical protein [Thermoleophilia bacterium]
MRRVLLVLSATVAAAAALAAPAVATSECDGLLVCVPVAGPWVVVPSGLTVPRARVDFQLACPRGHVVAGLDAELSHRGIDVSFSALLGSPVGPGVSTERSALFSASYAGGTKQATSFRPHIGCVPTAGGGARIPVAHTAFPPGPPSARRVTAVRVPAVGGVVRARRACARDERLVSGWHALTFRTEEPPTARHVAAATVTRTVTANAVTVVVRGGPALRGVRALVQVGAVCAGDR